MVVGRKRSVSGIGISILVFLYRGNASFGRWIRAIFFCIALLKTKTVAELGDSW